MLTRVNKDGGTVNANRKKILSEREREKDV